MRDENRAIIMNYFLVEENPMKAIINKIPKLIFTLKTGSFKIKTILGCILSKKIIIKNTNPVPSS